MIDNIYNRQDLNKLLHKIISKTNQTNQPISEFRQTKHYFLSTTVELIMKYHLLKIDKVFIEQFINELDYLLNKEIEYIDYLKQANQLLLNYVTTKLEIEDPTLTANKKKIIEYTYDTYIKEGCYFSTFLNKDSDKVEKTGLATNDYFPMLKQMEEIEEIYVRRRLPLPFGVKVESLKKEYIELTDSIAIAYFQGLEMPQYLSTLTSTYSEMSTKEYDQDAYLRKDLNACTNNIELFMVKQGFNDSEKSKIISFIKESFKNLNINSKDIPVAMINRASLGKNQLPDYDEIMGEINNRDLVYSFSRIIDGRHTSEKKFAKVLSSNIQLLSLPSYYRIVSVPFHQTKTTPIIKKTKVTSIRHYTMTKGMVNILALAGMIIFVVGLTLLLIYTFIGG